MRLIDVTMIGVGAMIGAGIFVLTGIAAGVAGPALLVVFLLNGLVALLTAMAYAELGGAIHGAGGGYLWIKRSLPDPSGFLAGWMDWFAHAVACSLYALGFGAYFKEVLSFVGAPEFHPPLFSMEIWLAVAACGFFTLINYRGAAEAGKAGNVVTIGKIAIIGAFIVAGLWTMVNRPGWQGSFTPFMTEGWAGIFAAMGLTFIAFEGYEIIAQTSEEVEDPKRNVPRAVFLSLLIVIPIYLLVALVAIGAVTPPPGMSVTQYLGEQKEIALVTAADQFVVGGAIVILAGGLLSTLSALNATIYSSSRVAFAMARDASLPQVVARVHPKRSTPHWAILLSALIIIGMAVALPIEEVVPPRAGSGLQGPVHAGDADPGDRHDAVHRSLHVHPVPAGMGRRGGLDRCGLRLLQRVQPEARGRVLGACRMDGAHRAARISGARGACEPPHRQLAYGSRPRDREETRG
jgi:amino acid transporter